MASTFSTNLRLELITTGEKTNTWGDITNTNVGTLLEAAISGVVSVPHDDTANDTLTALNGSDDESRNMVLQVTGALSANRNLVCPTAEKIYIVSNATTGGFNVTLKTSGGSGITIPNGNKMGVYCDGTNVVDLIDNLPSGATVGGTEVVTLTSSQTLTNKTLTLPVITSISNVGTVTIPSGTDTLVARASTDTLTNKTLTLPVITSISNSGTVTIPSGADTLVARASTDTLTNKTINLTSNTLVGTTAQFNTALSDGSFATLSGAGTLTNKIINSANNTITVDLGTATVTGSLAEFNTALQSASFATLAGSETLTNKTVNSASNTLTVNLSTATVTGTFAQFNTALSDETFTALGKIGGFNAQTGTTYTAVLSDIGKAITMNNASANTLTIPPNSSVAYAVGSWFSIIQIGAGATTVTGGTGVTVNGVSTGGAVSPFRYGFVTVVKQATNTWFMNVDGVA